jgi:hypothetical protein
MGKPQVSLGPLLHGAGDVDQEQDPALPGTPTQLPQTHHLAVVSNRFAQALAQVGCSAAPVSISAIAASPRQPFGQRALESPQDFGIAVGAEAARGKHFGGRSLLSGLQGVVVKRWSDAPAIALADANPILLVRPSRFDGRDLSEKMLIEQGIEFHAPLGWRAERCMGGASNVGNARGPEQVDSGKKGDDLFGRNQELMTSKQRREVDEKLRHTRQAACVAHAAISAITASSRGAI